MCHPEQIPKQDCETKSRKRSVICIQTVPLSHLKRQVGSRHHIEKDKMDIQSFEASIGHRFAGRLCGLVEDSGDNPESVFRPQDMHRCPKPIGRLISLYAPWQTIIWKSDSADNSGMRRRLQEQLTSCIYIRITKGKTKKISGNL